MTNPILLFFSCEYQTYIEERFENATESDYFTVTLYQMDIERVKYSLSRYLRTR